ncbi:MAG: MFS transporter [Trebonia sp.]
MPRAALTAFGGVLADRIGPRTVMLVSDAVRCALTALFAVFAAQHTSSLAALAPVAAVLGACAALFMPASYTIMPSLLDGGQLSSANAIYQAAVQTGSLIGPVIGGVIVAAAGPTTAFGVDAASYLVSAGSLALIGVAASRALVADAGPGEPGAPADAKAGGPGPDSAPGQSGWRLLLHARVLQILFLVSLTANFALTGTTEIALPALAHDRFGADGYGAILTCLAAGSLAGTIIVVRVGRDRVRPVTLLGGAFLVAAVAIALVPFLGGLPGAAAAMPVFGVAIGFDGSCPSRCSRSGHRKACSAASWA